LWQHPTLQEKHTIDALYSAGYTILAEALNTTGALSGDCGQGVRAWRPTDAAFSSARMPYNIIVLLATPGKVGMDALDAICPVRHAEAATGSSPASLWTRDVLYTTLFK